MRRRGIGRVGMAGAVAEPTSGPSDFATLDNRYRAAPTGLKGISNSRSVHDDVLSFMHAVRSVPLRYDQRIGGRCKGSEFKLDRIGPPQLFLDGERCPVRINPRQHCG